MAKKNVYYTVKNKGVYYGFSPETATELYTTCHMVAEGYKQEDVLTLADFKSDMSDAGFKTVKV